MTIRPLVFATSLATVAALTTLPLTLSCIPVAAATTITTSSNAATASASSSSSSSPSDITEAAGQGSIDAAYQLAERYRVGRGVEKDEAQAVHWYRQAAEKGHAESQLKLGLCYLIGRGVEADLKEAHVWLDKAAFQDNVNAQIVLGRLYLAGQGVEKNLTVAKAWFEKACRLGGGEGCVAYAKLVSDEQAAQDAAAVAETADKDAVTPDK